MNEINLIGGSGFIGSHFCHLLKSKKTKFTIFDKAISQEFPSNHLLGDVREIDSLRQHIVEGAPIINLAAEHRDDVRPRSLYYDVNVEGAKNICKVAVEKNINTIVFTSTVALYGFAPIGTDESGDIQPFNDYGKSKYQAELAFKDWQDEDPKKRTLVIIRPTVVFGEKNRGNVYNLFNQIFSKKFMMVGNGENSKSMAYVENIASFINFSLDFKPGVHIYNYIDKPDFTMNSLVSRINEALGRSKEIKLRLPYLPIYFIAKIIDLVALITNKQFNISSIRIKKFCQNTVFDSSVSKSGFKAPVSLEKGLERTIQYEFLEDHKDDATYIGES